MQSVTETLRKYCGKHKGEIFDVGFLHSKFFNHIGESSFRKFVSRIVDEGLLVPVGKGIYTIGEVDDLERLVISHYTHAFKGMPAGDFLFYKNGIGVQKDLKEAFKWYEEGSKCKEHPEISQFQLARCYENGIGTDKNLKRALEIYIDSAEKGCIDSMDQLADSYLTGTLTAIDKEEAEKWFRKAVDYGDDYARVQLANICFNKILGGYEAKKLVEEAAENGYAYAEYLLGYFYKYGEHYNQNEREAMIWLGRAARKGQKAAIEELKGYKYSD